MNRLKPWLYWLWKVLPIPRRARWVLLWLGNTKFLIGVVAIIFDEAERVLILKHTYRNRYPWGLPGGWVGRREPLERALARELAEETGLTINVGEVVSIRSDHRYPKIDVFFLCQHHGGEFRPDAEIAAMRFCPLDDLPPDMLPDQIPMLSQALAIHRARQGEGSQPVVDADA